MARGATMLPNKELKLTKPSIMELRSLTPVLCGLPRVPPGRLEWPGGGRQVTFQVELEREADGRWIAEVSDLPGVLAYGATQDEAQARVQALALRVVAERLEHGEAGPQLLDISFR